MLINKPVSWIIRDRKIRLIYNKYEIKKKILKSLIYASAFCIGRKNLFFDFKFKKFTYKSSICKYRSNCMFLGNSRSILQQFKLSRHACKKYAAHGFLTGLGKASF